MAIERLIKELENRHPDCKLTEIRFLFSGTVSEKIIDKFIDQINDDTFVDEMIDAVKNAKDLDLTQFD